MNSHASFSTARDLTPVVDRLAETCLVFLLETRADGTKRVVAERSGREPRYRYLAAHLRPVETVLVRLLERWGDGYGSALLFELWGRDQHRYGAEAGRLRRAALIGKGSEDADYLIRTIAEAMQGGRQFSAAAQNLVSDAT